MSVRNLEYLFQPTSVAVIGASNQPHSVGLTVIHNLLEGGFAGPIVPVNPKYEAVAGVLTYPDVASLPLTPDLAVICTPAAMVPNLITELGARGTKAAVVLTAGLSRVTDAAERTLQDAMLEAARPHLLRILGPNCLGLLVPGLGLNASFAHTDAAAGKVSVIHQSGALCTALLDWARARGIGFSHFISLGDGADVDFGDVLDYLGSDPTTRAIMLYIESVRYARKFMSAARAAARNKPVLVIKAGRFAEGARAAASHTGALAGADDVFDAAIRRAGMLRVFETDEMFDAVETLARAQPLHGDRLAILTNGGGPGVMATDALIDGGGRLADLSDDTIGKLDKVLPSFWSHGNPVDIIGDAGGDRYAAACKILLAAPEIDALLVMYAPTAVSSSEEAAQTTVAAAKEATGNACVSTCWLGETAVTAARRIFNDAGIPTYETPGKAVRAFLHTVHYKRNQEMLMETPPSAPTEFAPSTATARSVVQRALINGRRELDEADSKVVLAAYGVPVVETHIASSSEDAVRLSEELGYPVALKILSPDISHKSDVGGVSLDLESAEAVQNAAKAMTARAQRLMPSAQVAGFTVQRMVRRPGAHELIVGATTDPIFGPVLLFGQGGTAVEIIADRAMALPPLNISLAREVVSRTRVSRLLAGYRDRPTANLAAVYLTLIQISQLIVDIPEVVQLDINPLLTDDRGVLALDARIVIEHATAPGPARLAIRPYPGELEETVRLKSGDAVFMRPIRPDDEAAHAAFLARLSPEDIRFRFFGMVRDFPHGELARFTQIDYDREMAFIAKASGNAAPDGDEANETLGVVRTVTDPNNDYAEFAIVIRSDLKGQGLGLALLQKMIHYCRRQHTGEVVGQVLPDNSAMLGLARRLGFKSQMLPGGDAIEVRLKLRDSEQDT